MQDKRLFTAPRTKGPEDKKTQRTQRKDRKQLTIGSKQKKRNTRIFGHRFSQVDTDVKGNDYD